MSVLKKAGTALAAAVLLAGSMAVTARADGDIIAVSDYDLTAAGPTCLGSNLADLTADAMRWYAGKNGPYKKADFAWVSEAVFTGSIPAGEISEAAIRNAIAEDAVMVEIKTTGGQIMRALEATVANVPEADPDFVTPANLAYVIDMSQPGIPADERYSEKKSKILGLDTLDDDENMSWIENYRVVLDAGSLAYLPNLLEEDATMVVEQENGVSLREIVTAYLRDGLKGTVTETYADEHGDGRILVVSPSEVIFDEENNSYEYKLRTEIKDDKGIYWIAVPEDKLSRKLQGIIGNRLYRGSFRVKFNGSEEDIICAQTRYNVIIPVTEPTGSFTLAYNEIIGNTGNLLILLAGMAVFGLIIGITVLINRTGSRRQSKYNSRRR